ncbi:unnamed protein product [Adineta steineri]|uniref:RBR-type E3 ubiquitin transferase n=1 Tax=Adineta steineri TaxID=433720 RepID=A0A813P9X2_9BILA|nr:unnamed protein product [Adineta steineri]CAF3958051.1 unnamed protein product [Adineta steineri]
MSKSLDQVLQANIYLQPVQFSLAIIANIINIRVLCSRVLRKSPCTHYFLAYAITNGRIGCKIHFYILFLLPFQANLMLILASFDRYCSSSRSRRIHSRSTIQKTRINIISGTILSAIYMSPMLVIYKWNEIHNKCLQQTNILISIYIFSQVFLYYVLLPLLMMIFGFMTISNIRQHMSRARLVTASIRRRRTEGQLTRMLCLQVSVHLILALPFVLHQNSICTSFIIIMTNSEKQADEILALQSIFDQNFRLFNGNQYEISVEFDLPTSFTIQFNDKISHIRYLPPLSLIIQYHDEYPSDYPPSFILSCFYFSTIELEKLCQKLDNYLFIKGEVCVYDWIVLIQQEITNKLVLQTTFEKQENDRRALNGYTNENNKQVFLTLIDYNHKREENLFQNQLHICSICTDSVQGFDCIRLYRCGHFYCRSCLNNYIQMNLNYGKFGDKLHCPQDQCEYALLPTEVKQTVQDKELYEKYERLTLQHALDLMTDIVYCPRCYLPILSNFNDDNLTMCDRCHYTFCKKCKDPYHSQTLCPKDYHIEQIKLQQKKEKETVLMQLTKTNDKEKSITAQNYRQIIMKYSEQNRLLEEIMSAQRIDLLDAQLCPNCHIPIEKNGGCSHMFCVGCKYHFIWRRIDTSTASAAIPFLAKDGQNFNELETIKQNLNEASSLAESKSEEININIEDDFMIAVNNQSAIGSVILNRVRECPSKICQKMNVKITEDNWMVCSACMKQYCFLCGSGIHAPKHFNKKCLRYSSISTL